MIPTLPFLLIASMIIGCIEVDISAPSFPDISNYFAISDVLTQMTISVNFLGFCLSSFLYGPLSEYYGRRKIMVFGNLIMAIGACGCVFAPSIEFLLFARFIQGIGASTSAVVAFAIIADVYSYSVSIKLIGLMNSIFTICMSLAPVVRGVINKFIGWRANYSLLAIISILSWLSLFLFLPETKKKLEKFNAKKIFIDFQRILTDRRFLYSAFIPSIYYTTYLSFIACAPFLYMEAYKLPIIEYTLHQGAIVSGFSLFSMYSGRITDKFGEKSCIIYGTFGIFLGSLLICIINLISIENDYLATIAIIIFEIGVAIIYPIIFAKSTEIFPEIKGTCASAIISLRYLLCSVFVFLASYLYKGDLFNIGLIFISSSIIIIILTYKLLKLIPFVNRNHEKTNHLS